MQTSLKFILSIALIFFVSSCNSQSNFKNNLIIENAWARPTLKGSPSAVYFTLKNQLNETEKLMSVSSQMAEFNEIHLSSMEDGKMKMIEQESVLIESNQIIEFKPKSYHVMLINLKQDLEIGDQFELSLFFEKSGEKKILVEVKEFE
jgi:copper(I)-binding protein